MQKPFDREDAMWNYEHSITTSAAAEAIWFYYEDPARWPEWDPEIKELTLDRPFGPGASGFLHLHDLPPAPLTVTEVQPPTDFRTETGMPDGTVIGFTHRLRAETGGRVRITHGVEIAGPSAGAELGALLTAGVPDTMRRLADIAEADAE
ncbi:SRPBCC family protein [Streptomyces uncialis]|uniref:SRPBCC family protein n=1 Tax=Streptomyces uncialis TaxID=1048205 RepID=UPI00382FBBA9